MPARIVIRRRLSSALVMTVFDAPQNGFKPLLINSLRLASLVLPVLHGANLNPYHAGESPLANAYLFPSSQYSGRVVIGRHSQLSR